MIVDDDASISSSDEVDEMEDKMKTEPIEEEEEEEKAEEVVRENEEVIKPAEDSIVKPTIELADKSVDETIVEPAPETIMTPVCEQAKDPHDERTPEPISNLLMPDASHSPDEPISDSFVPIVEAVEESAPKSNVEPLVATISMPIIEAVAEVSSESVATEPVIKKVAEPILRPAVESIVKKAIEPAAEQIPKVVIESAVDSVVTPTIVTNKGSVSEPTSDQSCLFDVFEFRDSDDEENTTKSANKTPSSVISTHIEAESKLEVPLDLNATVDASQSKQNREYITELSQDGKLSLTIRKASQARDICQDLRQSADVRQPSGSASLTPEIETIQQVTLPETQTQNAEQVRPAPSSSPAANVKPTRRSARLMQIREKKEPGAADEPTPKELPASQPQPPAKITQPSTNLVENQPPSNIVPMKQVNPTEALKESQPLTATDQVEPPPLKTRRTNRGGKKTVVKTQPQPEPQVQHQPEPQLEPQIESESQRESQIPPSQHPETETQLQTRAEVQPQQQPEIQAQAQSQPQPQPQVHPQTQPVPPPASQVQTQTQQQQPQPLAQQPQPQQQLQIIPSYMPPKKRLGWFWSQKQLLEQLYLVVWTSRFTLKDAFAAVQMHFISGNNKMPSWSYRAMLDDTGMPLPIIINQRMRLDPDELEGVQRKMSIEEDHCVLLAVPVGRDQSEFLKQSTSLRIGFIDYLISKQAAGIVYVCQPGESQPSYIIHIFPTCSFVTDHIRRCEPDLLNVIQNIDNLIVVITTA